MANEKNTCNQICRWNDPSDGCIRPARAICPLSNTKPDASGWGQAKGKEKRLIDANDAEQFAREHILDANERYTILDFLRECATVDAVEVAEYDAIIAKLESLLCHATGGKYSKAGYSLEDMERMVTDYIKGCCEEAVAEEVVQGWISVNNRLPDKMGKYLCRYVFGENTEYPFEQVLYYYTAVEKPHFQNEGSLGLRVTHWMPLPEPPKAGD